MSWKCAICFSLLEENKDCSCTPCGHLFHSECLTRWFSSNGGSNAHPCPECRTPVDDAIKLYPSSDSDYQSFNKDEIVKELSCLKAELDLINLKVKHAEVDFVLEKQGAENLMVKAELEKCKTEVLIKENLEKLEAEEKLQTAESQLLKIRELQDQMLHLNSTLVRLTADFTFHEHAYVMVYGEHQEVEEILLEIQANVFCSSSLAEVQDSVKNLVRYCLILKRELSDSVIVNSNLKDQLMSFSTIFLESHKNFIK